MFDPQGKLTGIDVELMTRIAADLGVKVEFVTLEPGRSYEVASPRQAAAEAIGGQDAQRFSTE